MLGDPEVDGWNSSHTDEARRNCANGSSDNCRSLDHFGQRCKQTLVSVGAGLRINKGCG